MARNRTLGVLGRYLAGFAGAVALAIFATAIPPQVPFAGAIRLSCIAASVIVAFAFAGAAWRRTDEAAREAHKSASFWGMPFGLLAGLVALELTTVSSMPRDAFRADILALMHGLMPHQPLVLMLCGAVIVVLPGLAGYLFAWIGWWIAHNGRTQTHSGG